MTNQRPLMATTSEIVKLLPYVGTWLTMHGSELVIGIISAIVGAAVSAVFDLRGKSVTLATRFKLISKDNSHHNTRADTGGVAVPQNLDHGATGQVAGGNGNLTVQVGGNLNGNLVLPGVPGREEVALPYEENAFVLRVVTITTARSAPTTFSDHYRTGFGHLGEGHAALAASEYHCAFRQIRDTVLDRSTYSTDLNEGLLSALETGFRQLATFSDTGNVDLNNLRTILSGLENTLKSIFAYVP